MISGSHIGLLLALTSALCFGTMNIAVKMSAPWVTVWQSGAGRFVLGLVLVPLLMPFIRGSLRMRDYGWLLFRSVVGVLAFMLMVIAFETVPLSEAMVLYYINPAVSALIAPLLVGERTPARDWPLIIGAFGGIVLVLAPSLGGSGEGFRLAPGHLLALAAGVSYSLTIISTRRVIKSNSPWAIYFNVCLVGLVMCAWPMFMDDAPLIPSAWQGWLGLAVTGLAAMAAQVTMNTAMTWLKSHHAGVILSLEALIASAFGVAALGEPLSWNLVVGGVLVLGCGLALNLGRGERDQKKLSGGHKG